MHTETDQTTPDTLVPPAASSTTVAATTPGQIRVIKRNGTVVPYGDDKIAVAMTKAFLAVEGGNAAASSRVHETVAAMTKQISETFKRRMPSGGTIHIEDIQDQVELTLMRTGEQKVARDYVLYREKRAQQRAELEADAVADNEYPSIQVKNADGSTDPLNIQRLRTIVSEACEGLAGVDGKAILDEAMRNLYNGVSIDDVNTSLVITARTLVEKEPNYSQVTARLLLDKLRAEALSHLQVANSATQHDMETLYPQAFNA
jgi:ribonucleoside-diphosphate reductase alpha chain